MTVHVEKLFVPAILMIATMAVLFILRSVASRLLHAWAAKTETRIDDIVIKSLKMPSLCWILALGLYAGQGGEELVEIIEPSECL
jgi:hypothetical protein